MKKLAKFSLTLMIVVFALLSYQPAEAAEAGEYCTRAIDFDGVFCFIGCPEGCRCDVFSFYSQCCCDV